MLPFCISHRFQHYSMYPVTCSTAVTAETLSSAGEKVLISWDQADRNGSGGLDTSHFLWLSAGPPLMEVPKNFFAITFPTVSVPGYLGTDSFSACIQINSQFRIFAIFTVADPQNLYQRNLTVFRCVFLITTVQTSRIKFQWFIILNRINTDFRILPYYHFIFNKYSP